MGKEIGAAFTEREDSYLQKHHKLKTTAVMAAHLGRTVSSTQNRIRHLGLKKRAGGEAKPQTKVSQFFDDDLMPILDAGAAECNLSRSAYVQELVRVGLRHCEEAS